MNTPQNVSIVISAPTSGCTLDEFFEVTITQLKNVDTGLPVVVFAILAAPWVAGIDQNRLRQWFDTLPKHELPVYALYEIRAPAYPENRAEIDEIIAGAITSIQQFHAQNPFMDTGQSDAGQVPDRKLMH